MLKHLTTSELLLVTNNSAALGSTGVKANN